MRLHSHRALLALACVLALSSTAGCGDACRSHAEQICACLPDDGSRAACTRRAKEAEVNFPVSAADQQRCQQLIDQKQCDCKVLNTPEGKLTCGLAWNGTP
jgi:hypothetical protein